MTALARSVETLCVFGVLLGVVFLLLPQGSLGDLVKTGGRLLLVGLIVQTLFALPSVALDESGGESVSEFASAEEYISTRLAESITGPLEGKVKEILAQFGITDGQICIELNKGRCGELTLAHIAVGIPHRYEGERASLKKLLLKRFDVYCDVYLLEDVQDET